MTPREAKPPAAPIEMPRTEEDLHQILKAIEEHQAAGHTLGTWLLERRKTALEILDLAAIEDDRLYTLVDKIMEEREKEMTQRIEDDDK